MDEVEEGLRKCLEEIQRQIDVTIAAAVTMGPNGEGIDPFKMQDTTGRYCLAPLLVSKAELLVALIPFEQRRFNLEMMASAKQNIAKVISDFKEASKDE